MTIRQVSEITRRELRGFFDQPTAYVLAVAFLGLGLYLAFRSLFAMSYATLRPFFDLLPWLLVVFVPAVAMKSLAEERRGRTLEWLLAQPLTETEIVLGKFAGNWLFVLITIAGTLPMAVGVLMASDADPGIMLAQYVGAALLSAQMIAIGVWASSITRNQITAFILGATICLVLVLLGTPVVQIGLPPALGNLAAQLSVISHFENVARGVVDLRDLLYFASTCGLFLLLAVATLGRERLSRQGDAYRRLRLGTGAVALAVVLLNLLGANVRGRVDLTRDGLFTLSAGSRDILGDLDDVVNLTLFTSDDLPPEIQLRVRDVRDLVADMSGASDGMLAVRNVNPDDGDEEAEEATSVGIMQIEFNVLRDDELQVKRGYFGLAVSYADEQETIPVIDRADDLEFRLVSAIARMTAVRRPTLAFARGFEAKEAFQYATFRQSVADRYAITSVELAPDSAAPSIPDSIDVLVVAAPAQPLSADAVDAIRAYLDQGGAALLLMERHVFNAQSPTLMPLFSGLEALLAEYGVTASGEIVFDLASAERVEMRQGYFTVVRDYPLWPVAFRGEEHATNRDLGNATFGWAAPFTWEEGDPTVTALWTTTESGGTRPPGMMADPSFPIGATQDEVGIQTLAVAIDPSRAEGGDGGGGGGEEGADGAEEEPAAGADDAEPDAAGADATEPDATEPDAAASDDERRPRRGRIIAVGDADFLEEQFARANAQNVLFAANAVDWLAQDEALIAIRSKDRTPPVLAFESDAGRNALKWGSLVGVPVLFALLGLARVTRRGARAERRWSELVASDEAASDKAASDKAASDEAAGDPAASEDEE